MVVANAFADVVVAVHGIGQIHAAAWGIFASRLLDGSARFNANRIGSARTERD